MEANIYLSIQTFYQRSASQFILSIGVRLIVLYMLSFIFHTVLECSLPLLNPIKDQTAKFRHGAIFAVAAATALPAEIMENIKVHPSTNSSLSMQLDWMSSHLEITCHTDCPEKLNKSLFLVGEIGGNECTHGLLEVILTKLKTDNSSAYGEHHCLKDFNNLIIFFNDHLRQAIEELKKEYPNITLIYGDYYNAYLWLLQNAASLEFEKKLSTESLLWIRRRL
ncbi:gdsl esteraselipase [Nicotiana attenuata]|uniref:Gdsl esteraselipase n=1 Tax=Nicotiana attenuata TaxID=49451 RepID=A0A314L468_NICAT|nr:gdsl esteraselipase [Nicotiana attenuata]